MKNEFIELTESGSGAKIFISTAHIVLVLYESCHPKGCRINLTDNIALYVTEPYEQIIQMINAATTVYY